VAVKDAGPLRLCPFPGCLRWYAETMPVGQGAALRWVPRPICTCHNLPSTGVYTPPDEVKQTCLF
jgi:hypothetical protein